MIYFPDYIIILLLCSDWDQQGDMGERMTKIPLYNQWKATYSV